MEQQPRHRWISRELIQLLKVTLSVTERSYKNQKRCMDQMLKLKKQTVFALKEFIRIYSPESTPSEKTAMLNEAVKNFELYANGNAGHDCCKGIVPSASGKDLEIHYAYQMPMRKPEWIFINPQTDFEEVHA